MRDIIFYHILSFIHSFNHVAIWIDAYSWLRFLMNQIMTNWPFFSVLTQFHCHEGICFIISRYLRFLCTVFRIWNLTPCSHCTLASICFHISLLRSRPLFPRRIHRCRMTAHDSLRPLFALFVGVALVFWVLSVNQRKPIFCFDIRLDWIAWEYEMWLAAKDCVKRIQSERMHVNLR